MWQLSGGHERCSYPGIAPGDVGTGRQRAGRERCSQDISPVVATKLAQLVPLLPWVNQTGIWGKCVIYPHMYVI